MTKDEAKELDRSQCWKRIVDIFYESIQFPTTEDIIQQNWPQISKQLDEWFTEAKTTCLHKEITYWWETEEFNSDTITWMLRAFVASKEG